MFSGGTERVHWEQMVYRTSFTFNKLKHTLAAFKENASGKSNQVAFFGTGKTQSPDLRSGLLSMFLA